MQMLKWFVFAAALSLMGSARAAVVQLSFDSLADGDVVSSQFSGLVFSNAMALTAGISLNEFEFPPRSGDNVIVDNGGALIIDFIAPVQSVGAYFTYATVLTANAYDASHNLLGSLSSIFLNNASLSGDIGSSPNELISFSFATPITQFEIIGDPAGFSFVMDDLTYSTVVKTNGVPEPASLALVALSLICMPAVGRGRSHRRKRETCSPGVMQS